MNLRPALLWRRLLAFNPSEIALFLALFGVLSAVIAVGVLQTHEAYKANQRDLLNIDATRLALELEAESAIDETPRTVTTTKGGLVLIDGTASGVTLNERTKLEFYERRGEDFYFCLTGEYEAWSLYDSGSSVTSSGPEDKRCDTMALNLR